MDRDNPLLGFFCHRPPFYLFLGNYLLLVLLRYSSSLCTVVHWKWVESMCAVFISPLLLVGCKTIGLISLQLWLTRIMDEESWKEDERNVALWMARSRERLLQCISPRHLFQTWTMQQQQQLVVVKRPRMRMESNRSSCVASSPSHRLSYKWPIIWNNRNNKNKKSNREEKVVSILPLRPATSSFMKRPPLSLSYHLIDLFPILFSARLDRKMGPRLNSNDDRSNLNTILALSTPSRWPQTTR